MKHPSVLERLANEKINDIRSDGLANQSLRRAGKFGPARPFLFRQWIQRLLKRPTGKGVRQESMPVEAGFQSKQVI
jgi:hypothetical protein